MKGTHTHVNVCELSYLRVSPPKLDRLGRYSLSILCQVVVIKFWQASNHARLTCPTFPQMNVPMNEDVDFLQPSQVDDLANRLFFRLYQSANLLHKTGTKALDGTHITTQQWAVVGALARQGYEEGIAVGELTKFLLVSRQNLSGVLARLERDELIERVVSPHDSRSRLIRLTKRGRHLWRTDMSDRISHFYDAALAGFSTTDKIHAIHYFDKILTNLKQIEQDQGES